jgi:GlpG protein
MAEQPKFNPRQAPVTTAVIVLSVAMSLAYWAGRNMSWALESQEFMWRGQVWRLLTSTLLHVNILHLGFNVYWMAIFGGLIEEWLGSIKTLLLYVLLALASSAADFVVEGGGIGLSGIIYGQFGLLYAAGGRPGGLRFRLHPRVTQMLVGWFFLCIIMTYAKVMTVANVAHGAGALAGFALGRAILARRPRVWLGAITVGTLALCVLTFYMPWRYEWWLARGLRREAVHDDVRCREYWRRAIDLAGDDRVAGELCLFLAAKEFDAGNMAEVDALLERGVRVSVHPEGLRAWQAYYHWSAGDPEPAAKYLAGVRPVDIDQSLQAEPDFMAFAAETRHEEMAHIATRPTTRPNAH